MIESLLNLIFDRAHPVGSYYWSSNLTNPSQLFGGTWVQVTDKFVLAAGSTYKAGTTGGEANHILSISEIPSHSHGVLAMHYKTGANDKTGGDSGGNWTQESFSSSTTGSGKAHNNMPPYIVAYCWRRTA